MTSHRRILSVVISLGVGFPAMAAPVPSLAPAAIPTVQCIHHALKSSSAVQSVSLYSIDGFRFSIEFAFRNKDGQIVVSDIEFFVQGGTVTVGDKVPREVSMETASEAQDLESKLDLTSSCHLQYSFDNLLPWPKARADWQKMDWPRG